MINQPFDEPYPWQLLTRKFYKFRGNVIEIRKGKDGLWYDRWHCIYGIAEDENSVDKVDRCGIGIFSLPENHPANEGCKYHDFRYSSLAYQLYNSRAEADAALEKDLKILGYSWFGRIAHKISNWFGGRFWEVDKTR